MTSRFLEFRDPRLITVMNLAAIFPIPFFFLISGTRGFTFTRHCVGNKHSYERLVTGGRNDMTAFKWGSYNRSCGCREWSSTNGNGFLIRDIFRARFGELLEEKIIFGAIISWLGELWLAVEQEWGYL